MKGCVIITLLIFYIVFKILIRYCQPTKTQRQLFHDLFCSVNTSQINEAGWSDGCISRYANGKCRLDPKLAETYNTWPTKGRKLLTYDLKNHVFPGIGNWKALVEELHTLILMDSTIPDSQRGQLCRNYPCSSEETAIQFVADVLLHCLENNVKPHSSPDLENTSLSLKGILYGCSPPKPCSTFSGREWELVSLHIQLNGGRPSYFAVPPAVEKVSWQKPTSSVLAIAITT